MCLSLGSDCVTFDAFLKLLNLIVLYLILDGFLLTFYLLKRRLKFTQKKNKIHYP